MPPRLRDTALFRLLGTALLVLVLQIPIELIAHTIDERRTTRGAAIEEVTRTWGAAQELAGPILTVPVIEHYTDAKNEIRQRTVLHRFLPRTLTVSGRVATEVRRRGIFDVPLYTAELHVEAAFVVPEAESFAGRDEVLWKNATLALGISDPKAIRSASGFAWQPGAPDDLLAAGLHAPLPTVRPGPARFVFDLTLGGSSRLVVVPAGDDTVVSLRSPWPDPSFDGAWLPSERTVGAEGFDATWRVLDLARNFPSRWLDKQVDARRLSESAFGVSFLSPVDTYRTNERAVKYQLLFLGLTFLCFTLIELLASLRVHPVQYLLVGFALCLFYLLLLSLSEQIGFARAYAIASAAVVILVTSYVRAVLATPRRAATIGAFLSALYGFLYVLLQIQDYALLVGSAGLFVALGAVMWLTRRIDWYAIGARPDVQA
jgi:inner membrane protein